MVGHSFALGLLGLGATILAAPTPTKTTLLDDRAFVVGSGPSLSSPAGCIAVVWQQAGICILSPPTTTIFASTKRDATTITASNEEEVKRDTTPVPEGCVAIVWEYASVCMPIPPESSKFPFPTDTPVGCVEAVWGDAHVCLLAPATSTILPNTNQASGASGATTTVAEARGEAEVLARNTSPAPAGCIPVVWEYASICILAPATTTIFPSPKRAREVIPGRPISGPIIPARPFPGGPIVPDRPYPGGPIVPDRPYPAGPIIPDIPLPGGPFVPGR